MKPYALDRREKLLRADDESRGSPRALAAWFGVSRSCVEQLRPRRRSPGTSAPQPHVGGRQPRGEAAAREMVGRRELPRNNHLCRPPRATAAGGN
jgi:transposase